MDTSAIEQHVVSVDYYELSDVYNIELTNGLVMCVCIMEGINEGEPTFFLIVYRGCEIVTEEVLGVSSQAVKPNNQKELVEIFKQVSSYNSGE